MSELDTLRAELAAIRSGLDLRFSVLRTDLDELRTDLEVGFSRLDVQLERLKSRIDSKPGAGTIYRASFAIMTAIMVGTVILLKTLASTP